MEFKALQRVSLLDYPGKIAAIVFVGGCNFRCKFCYNRDLVLNHHALPSVPEEEVLRYLETHRDWLDGLVVTGGEPTLHPDLPNFLEKVKNLGLSVKLDTNGSNPEMLKELIKKRLVDYVAMDIKAPLIEEKYQAVIGVPVNGVVKEIERSIEILRNSEIEYEFRTTMAPGLVTKEDLELISSQIKGAKRFYIQQFKQNGSHVDDGYSSVLPYPLELLKEARDRIAQNFQVCGVRGLRLA